MNKLLEILTQKYIIYKKYFNKLLYLSEINIYKFSF